LKGSDGGDFLEASYGNYRHPTLQVTTKAIPSTSLLPRPTDRAHFDVGQDATAPVAL
jgi:hypothetical protein